MLIAAGDNSDRLHSEAAFAALCGVSPVEASSGKTQRRRLNRGGNRQANAALHRVALARLCWYPTARAYVERHPRDGKSRREASRCLKRYIARELYPLLSTPTARHQVQLSPLLDIHRGIKHAVEAATGENSRKGKRSKTVLTPRRVTLTSRSRPQERAYGCRSVPGDG